MTILSSPLPECQACRGKEPFINDVTHERGGVFQNMTIVLVGCVNGTATRGRGSKNLKDCCVVLHGGSRSSNLNLALNSLRRPMTRSAGQAEKGKSGRGARARPPSYDSKRKSHLEDFSLPSCNQAPKRVVTAIAIRPTPYVPLCPFWQGGTTR